MRLGSHKDQLVPVEHAPGHPERRGAQSKSGALRAGIFGANDGLVSNLSLIFGVAGATSHPKIVMLAGVAGLLAGAFSMGAGEYISMRVQRDVFEGLLEVERWELENIPDEELTELQHIYEGKGMPRDLALKVAETMSRDIEVALDTHAREELGLDPDELGSPSRAAVSSFITFSIGAFVPLLPFLIGSGAAAVVASAVMSGVTLFAVGGAMTIFTGKHFYWSGLRMLAVGTAAAAITFGVGSLLNVQGI